MARTREQNTKWCREAQDRYRKNQPVKYLCRLARSRCQQRNIEYCLDPSLIEWPTYCPLLGIKLDQYSDNIDVHGSLDRIDPTKGYIQDNVWVISHRANRIKSNATSDELLMMAQKLKEKENQK